MIPGLLCVGLITKNIAGYLPKTLKTVETYISLFEDYRVVMVDGYSTDSTKIIASSWCKVDPIKRKFISQPTNGLPRMPSICEARNTIVFHFSNIFGENVYLLILDADSPNAVPFDIEGFKTAFQTEIKWDAVFPNQKVKYYDLYALRDSQLTENYQLKYHYLNWQDGSMQNALKKYEHPKWDPSGFYPVNSAFGGAGLYKTQLVKNVKYDYKEQWEHPGNKQIYTVDSCEHVILHNQLVKNGGKLYINCNWIIGEHL